MDNDYYTYLHIEPDSDPLEVVYVGKGRYGRAWDVTRCRSRNSEHQSWMQELSKLGYIPTDWAVILEKNLTEDEAYRLEREYMHNNGAPRFNRNTGENNHQAKMTNEQAREAFRLAKEGVRHQTIADMFGVSRSAISMIASGKQWRSATADLRREYEFNKNG